MSDLKKGDLAIVKSMYFDLFGTGDDDFERENILVVERQYQDEEGEPRVMFEHGKSFHRDWVERISPEFNVGDVIRIRADFWVYNTTAERYPGIKDRELRIEKLVFERPYVHYKIQDSPADWAASRFDLVRRGSCPECKGTGKYVGFLTVEPCRTCR